MEQVKHPRKQVIYNFRLTLEMYDKLNRAAYDKGHKNVSKLIRDYIEQLP